MKNPNEETQMPPAMLEKLKEVRARARNITLRTGLHWGFTVLLGVMLLAMAIDWLVVLHDTRWRWALTLLSLTCAAVAFARGCLLPLLRPRSLAAIAREVDRAHPSLEERYLTVAGFAQSQDAPALRGSEAMLRQVAQEAGAMTGGIAVDSVISQLALIRARRFFLGVAGVLLLLLAVNFSQTKVLCERFWMPGADLSLTRLQARNGDILIGKGESVKLEILESGKSTASASLFIQSPNHNEIISLPRSTNGASFVYSRDAVKDSFEYRARAGDGQTAWHRVTVLERPKISQVKLRIVPPSYSHLPTMEQNALPRRTSALEGSQMEVSFQSDQPLASMGLKLGDGNTQPIAESADHTYHFRTLLTNTLAFTPVFTNLQHLGNQSGASCEIAVYPDQPPTVNVITPDSKITARPDDTVKIEFEAKDDIGLAKAELVATVKNETNETSVVIPIPLGAETGAKQIHKQIDLDLAQFKLKQNDELSYMIRVTDTKENPAVNSASTPEPSANTNAANPQLAGTPPVNPQNKPPGKHTDERRDNSTGNPPQSRKDESAQADDKLHLAMNSIPPKPRDPNELTRPSNNLPKRVLDAGQCSSCQPMHVLVDEWGKSFEGQMRDKLEIAIDPVLKSLDDLLGKAQQLTDDTLETGKSGDLGQKQKPAVDSAKADLRQADAVVTELKKVSHDTPYTFIGLQVHDIRETHISPARKNLGNVTLEPADAKEDITHLEHTSFEIMRAREKLANLTRTYESVKRDNKIADAMQRLAKMHQIFLEDTQALLGSKKPVLNPQERKVAEVSDEFADKLQKLLEEKKKIMAELSRILADDPRLLRRFLALEELEGTTLRDQMTLLANRQRTLAGEVAQWANADGTYRDALLRQFTAAQTAEQADTAERAAKLQENMVTWLPLDVPQNEESVVMGQRKIAIEAARLAEMAVRRSSPETPSASLESARQALDQFRLLQQTLPGLLWLETSDKISIFEANRLSEAADLITRQSGWIKKIEALNAGDYPQVAEVDQHRLSLDTAELGEKLDSTAASVGGLSAEIKAKATELTATMHEQILSEETAATKALSHKTISQAAIHQGAATNAFARAEIQFDDLLHLIIAKLDAAPPPTEVGKNKSLEEMLAMLQDEQKAAEKLGIPCRPLNVSIMKDWLKSSSSPSSANVQQAQAQARAAQTRARKAKQKTERTRDESRQQALRQIAELPASHAGVLGDGPKRPTASWNTIASQIGDEIRQGRDNIPPEQYRQAIEHYFDTISDQTKDVTPTPAGHAEP